jgi:NAD(P)-dependent dehydrogenase (short-subunit alcohol dehydrogenase family)
MYNPMDMTGKRILVTGASSGIGRSCAIILSRLGAEIVLVARNEARLRETVSQMEGQQHLVMPYDLTDVENVESVFVKACGDGRKLDGLVHAAGVSALVPLQMTTPKLVQDILTLNFTAFLMLARQFARKKFTSGGSIVGISSVAAGAGQPSLSAYSGSKGALEAAVRSLALELVPKSIRVNSVVPCYIKTPMQEDAAQVLPEEAFQRIVSRHPMGLGSPEDVARAIAFLLSDAAKFITGSNLVVDGGYLAG